MWLGGGARGVAKAATALVDRGFCAVTSTNRRGIVAEAHKANLGAFNMSPEAQAIYDTSDLMIVVGSRLRGKEARDDKMRLPAPLIQVDVGDTQAGRNYPVDLFIGADASSARTAILV